MEPNMLDPEKAVSGIDRRLGLSCPRCRGILERDGQGGFRCKREFLYFPRQHGYLDFLSPFLEPQIKQFLKEYQWVRQEEGWGSNSSDYYQSLPYCHEGHTAYPWKIRCRSYECLGRLMRAARRHTTEIVLDAGCGNGWLSYRLALEGYQTVAVDLSNDARDGLRACKHYLDRLPRLRALACFRSNFDRLPFEAGQFDWVVFNASFHYSSDYRTSVAEALRILKSHGHLAVMDSPTYRTEFQGDLMVEERKKTFNRRYGFPSDTLGSKEYLTPSLMQEIGESFDLRWKSYSPRHGWRFRLRPVWALLRGGRQGARFPLWLAQKP